MEKWNLRWQIWSPSKCEIGFIPVKCPYLALFLSASGHFFCVTSHLRFGRLTGLYIKHLKGSRKNAKKNLILFINIRLNIWKIFLLQWMHKLHIETKKKHQNYLWCIISILTTSIFCTFTFYEFGVTSVSCFFVFCLFFV